MTKLIPLSQNGKNRGLYEAIVDDRDYKRVSQFKWSVAITYSGYVYAVRSVGKKTIYMHRFIVNAPDAMLVDHVHGNGLNNTRSNIRVATAGQNSQNRKRRIDNRSGFKGVVKIGNKFVAKIRLNYIGQVVGSFATPEEAARAYDLKAIELHGKFARTNFPRSDYEMQA